MVPFFFKVRRAAVYTSCRLLICVNNVYYVAGFALPSGLPSDTHRLMQNFSIAHDYPHCGFPPAHKLVVFDRILVALTVVVHNGLFEFVFTL